jgi:rhodanese-related sulfurtransferase
MTFSIIHPKDIKRLTKEKTAIIIDVREREKYEAAHLQGAINIPYENMERSHGDPLGNLAGARRGNSAIIVYCEYGSTSIMTARRLGSLGYEVYAVAGGYEAIRRGD